AADFSWRELLLGRSEQPSATSRLLICRGGRRARLAFRTSTLLRPRAICLFSQHLFGRLYDCLSRDTQVLVDNLIRRRSPVALQADDLPGVAHPLVPAQR